MVGHHDVPFDTLIEDGETTHVVGVEFSDVLNMDVKFIGSNRW